MFSLKKSQIQIATLANMKCQHCKMRVEEALSKLPNVKKVTVDLATQQAEIKTTELLTPEQVKNAVEEIGFEFVSLK